MKRNSTLLKIVSILYIIFSVISGIFILVGSTGIGLLLGGAAGDVGAGIALTMFFAIFSLIGVVLGLVAGIQGLKATNLRLCHTLAIILVVLAGISFLNNIFNGEKILTATIGLLLPILYMVGVYQEMNNI